MFMRPTTRDDLQRRMEGHRRIADFTYGMFGRSPDHVASFVTGMSMNPAGLPAPHAYADNLLKYYKAIRDNDTYVVYAVVPPQAARNPEFYQKKNIPLPTLRVVREEDDGVVVLVEIGFGLGLQGVDLGLEFGAGQRIGCPFLQKV